MSERIVFRVLIGICLALILGIYAIVHLGDNATPGKAQPSDPYAQLDWHDSPRALPGVQFNGPDGAPVAIGAFHGRAVLLNLWASWCQPCIEEMPALSRLEKDLGGDKFTVVTVSLDMKPEDGKQWLATNHIENLPLYSDPKGKLFDALKAPGLPLSLFVDAEGRELGRVSGALPWDDKDARILISKLGTLSPPAGQ